jgi:hypothetical protein
MLVRVSTSRVVSFVLLFGGLASPGQLAAADASPQELRAKADAALDAGNYHDAWDFPQILEDDPLLFETVVLAARFVPNEGALKRDRRVKEAHSRQVVEKCQSPVAPIDSMGQPGNSPGDDAFTKTAAIAAVFAFLVKVAVDRFDHSAEHFPQPGRSGLSSSASMRPGPSHKTEVQECLKVSDLTAISTRDLELRRSGVSRMSPVMSRGAFGGIFPRKTRSLRSAAPHPDRQKTESRFGEQIDLGDVTIDLDAQHPGRDSDRHDAQKPAD